MSNFDSIPSMNTTQIHELRSSIIGFESSLELCFFCIYNKGVKFDSIHEYDLNLRIHFPCIWIEYDWV